MGGSGGGSCGGQADGDVTAERQEQVSQQEGEGGGKHRIGRSGGGGCAA